jgi:hypothetical protein
MNWLSVFEVVEAQVGRRQHLGHHDDLTRVHRNGKRNLTASLASAPAPNFC